MATDYRSNPPFLRADPVHFNHSVTGGMNADTAKGYVWPLARQFDVLLRRGDESARAMARDLIEWEQAHPQIMAQEAEALKKFVPPPTNTAGGRKSRYVSKAKPPTARPCVACGGEFLSARPWSRVCSDPCRLLLKRKRSREAFRRSQERKKVEKQ